MKQQVLAAGFVLFSFMLPLKASAAQFSSLFVFGDSLSDTGNSSPPFPYVDGRFSNGNIWIDTLAEKLGLDSPTLFTQVAQGVIPKDGINFAFGGATTTVSNTVSSLLPGLPQEIGAFTNFLNQTQQPADPNALYILSFGANDYLPTTSQDFTPFTTSDQTISNITDAVRTLATFGAKNILLANLPDLGKTPLAQGLDPFLPSVPTGTSQRLTDLTIQHNSNLLAAINDLDNELDSGVKLISLDVYSRFNEILSNPNQFGLQNVTQPCITEQSCLFDPNIQNQYVFWDGTHPTTAVHQLIGQFAFETLKAEKARSIPESSAMLGILTVGAMGAMGMIKGQKRKSKLNLTSPIAEAQSFHSMVES